MICMDINDGTSIAAIMLKYKIVNRNVASINIRMRAS